MKLADYEYDPSELRIPKAKAGFLQNLIAFFICNLMKT